MPPAGSLTVGPTVATADDVEKVVQRAKVQTLAESDVLNVAASETYRKADRFGRECFR